jgi:hypothetical protein
VEIRTLLKIAYLLLIIGGVSTGLVVLLTRARRALRKRRLFVSVAAISLVIWIFWLWAAFGVYLVHRYTSVCLPPGISVRYHGDGEDRSDCELPPR